MKIVEHVVIATELLLTSCLDIIRFLGLSADFESGFVAVVGREELIGGGILREEVGLYFADLRFLDEIGGVDAWTL